MQPASVRVLDQGRRSPGSTLRRWSALLVRAAKRAIEDDVPMLASALAYSAFFAIPATLLLAVGVFSLVADPAEIDDLMERLAAIVPAEAVTLVQGSLLQLQSQPSAGVVMTVVGLLLALWATTGAMTTLMTAINRAHERDDRRGVVKKRLIALSLVFCLGIAALLVTVLLVLGPLVEHRLGSALGEEHLVAWVWWTVEWPLLVFVLFAAFSAVFALACDTSERRWRAVSPGAAVAVLGWLAASAAFSGYASHFASYNKTWGSLSAAIVTLTWLWLSAAALLFGAEVDAEVARSSRSRNGDVPGSAATSRARP
jgi:membrane protein